MTKTFLKSITLTLAAFLATSGPSIASSWSFAKEEGISFGVYTPQEIDLEPSPLVAVFHDEIETPQGVANAFPLYELASAGKFKVLHFGSRIGDLDAKTMSRSDTARLVKKTYVETTSTRIARPDGVFLVGFGSVVPGLFEYACSNPGQIRGVIGIDYSGEAITCPDATGVVAMSIHSGKEAKDWTTAEQASRDYSDEDAMIETFRSAGGRVNAVPLKGNESKYPGFAAYFHEQAGASLQDITAYFVKGAMTEVDQAEGQ